MGESISDDQIREITDALLAGRKIEAIKIYREATGTSLKEAKDFIDDLSATLRGKHPDKFPVTKAGCASILIAMCGLGALGAGALRWLWLG